MGITMAKGKAAVVFFCQECGYESSKWMGQCPGCRQWNTFVEESAALPAKGKGTSSRSLTERPEPVALSEVSLDEEDRLDRKSTRLNSSH